MTIKKKLGIGVVFATTLLAAILLVSVVSAQGSETTQESETPQGSETMTVKLTFGPETLDKLKNDPNCVAAYGSIPAFTTSEERYQWIDTLGNILDKLYTASFMQNQENSKYFDPLGPIVTSGITFDGVIEINVNSSSKIDKSLLDEYYQIIDSKASSMGVKEVPVVFMRENDLTLDDFESSGLTETDENSVNDGASNINDSNENKSSKINSTPGFELLGSLVCLYGGWKLRKK